MGFLVSFESNCLGHPESKPLGGHIGGSGYGCCHAGVTNGSVLLLASHSGHSSAWKLAEGRGATTSRLPQHLARFKNSQAEAYAKSNAILQVTPDMPQPGNLQRVEALRRAVSRSTSRVLRFPRLRHMRSKNATLQVTPDMPQPGNLQRVEALRRAVSRSIWRVLRIPRLRHVRSKLQYKEWMSR